MTESAKRAIRFNNELWTAIKEAAEREHMGIGQWVRAACYRMLEQTGK
jgi:predicted DNA-binding ribbon-helix-helix protein